MSKAWSFNYVLEGKRSRPTRSLDEWGAMFRDSSSRQVAFTTIGDSQVSTVFTGVNYRLGEGPPLVFETLVSGGRLNDEMERYSTWEEAEAGHAAMVERVRAAAEVEAR